MNEPQKALANLELESKSASAKGSLHDSGH
jgi:hypothetical protein